MTGKTYVVGDIHGNYKGFIQAIERSPFNPSEDKLITLGDYVDGGVHIEILPIMKYLLTLPNWVGILGNHDKWFKDFLDDGGGFADAVWFRQGGSSTLKSIGIKHIEERFDGAIITGDIPAVCGVFLDELKLFYVDDNNNAYLHAGWRSQKDKIENSQSFQLDSGADLYWNRDFWQRAGSNAYPNNPYSKVFIGHTQDNSYPEKRKNVWNIDSGAGYDGRVTIMDVDSEKFWQSDTTPELYENFGFR